MTIAGLRDAAPELEWGRLSPALTALCDLCLLLDGRGVVQAVDPGLLETPFPEIEQWIGRPWVETVTAASRGPVEELLLEAVACGSAPRRQVTHLSRAGLELPVVYAAFRAAGPPGSVIAVGRDLRSVAGLQHGLVEARQTIERDYLRLRHLETRTRGLFQLSSEAVLVLDGATHQVVDANPAALDLLQTEATALIGRPCPFSLAAALPESRAAATLRGWIRSGPVTIRLTRSGGQPPASRQLLGLSLFVLDADGIILARLWPETRPGVVPQADPGARTLELLQSLPDGIVITDLEGQVRSSNPAFLALAQVPTPDRARGRALGRWLGRPGAELGLLLATLRQGPVRLFPTALRGEQGGLREVEVSAIAEGEGPAALALFLVRDVGTRGGPEAGQEAHDPLLHHLARLVGRSPVKKILRDVEERIERRLVQVALERASNNRTVAAQLLGLSRQSLYGKLRRHGLDSRGAT
jgi:transcriptional regulator PpsR